MHQDVLPFLVDDSVDELDALPEMRLDVALLIVLYVNHLVLKVVGEFHLQAPRNREYRTHL